MNDTGRLKYEDMVYWVWLTMVLSAGSEAFWNLSRGAKSVSGFAADIKNGTVQGLTASAAKRAAQISFSDASDLIERCGEKGIGIAAYKMPEYPSRLKRLANPPPVIFYKGRIAAMSASVIVSAAGSREPSEVSLKTAEFFAGELSARGAVLMTGMERGIDAAVNSAAAGAGFPGIAVCGRGITSLSNDERLIEKIVGNGGLVFAEYTNESDYPKVPFKKRNRLLCGASDAVLYIECSRNGHSLDLSHHAERLGKPVFAVPPPDLWDERYFGQRDLIRKGAAAAFDADDIMARLSWVGKNRADMLFEDSENSGEESFSDQTEKRPPEKSLRRKKIKKDADKGLNKSENSVTIDTEGLTEPQRIIVRLLKKKEILHIDTIQSETGFSLPDLMTDLMLLRIANVISELPGKNYKIADK